MEEYRKGNDALRQGKFEQALAHFAKSSDPAARWNACLVRLLLGDYSSWPDESTLCPGQGFDGTYKKPYYPLPLWDAQPTDKRVLLLADQGAGDTLLFYRFIEQAKALAPNLVIHTNNNQLKPLLKELNVCDVCNEFNDCSVCLPLMLLPERLKVREIAGGSYLSVGRRPEYTEMVAALAPSPRIGVCWSGNPSHPTNERRSVPKELLYGVGKFSLQAGDYDTHFVNLGPLMGDFLATAQLIQEMDVVVTVSTSVSVLAPAMGVKTLVLLDTLPFWMWGLDSRTPWFAEARLFRQGREGDWSGVIEAVRSHLLGQGLLG